MMSLPKMISQDCTPDAPVPGIADTTYARNPLYNDVVFVYSKNPQLIERFTTMRRELYDKDDRFIGFREFHHMEYLDYFSRHDYIQLLFKGERCIGGGRLTLVRPNEHHLLPLELDLNDEVSEVPPHYTLRMMMPELMLGQNGYVEASRMLVHPDYRKDIQYISQMFANFSLMAEQNLNARYFFAMTDKLRCRMYRKIAAASAKKQGIILDKLQLPDRPDFEGIPMTLMYWDLHKSLD